jgi:hypothetical protein
MSVCRELGQRDSARAPWIGAWRRLPAAWVLGLDKVEPQLAVRVTSKRVGHGRTEDALELLTAALRPGAPTRRTLPSPKPDQDHGAP